MTAPFQILPDLSADDLDRLRASIAERGVEVPVVVDEDGGIIDGHNRAMIAAALGIDCPRVVRAGLTAGEKRILAVELNTARRHMTDAQKAMAGRKIEPDIAERARLRQGARSDLATSATPVTEVRRTTDEVARTVGFGSGRTYERAKRTIEAAEQDAPDLLPKMKAGAIDLPEVRKELNRRAPASPLAGAFEAEGRAVLDRLPQTEIDAGREALREAHALGSTSHLFSQGLKALHAARLKIREIRPELLRELVETDPDERNLVKEAVDIQAEMMARCREALGVVRGEIRRVG